MRRNYIIIAAPPPKKIEFMSVIKEILISSDKIILIISLFFSTNALISYEELEFSPIFQTIIPISDTCGEMPFWDKQLEILTVYIESQLD